LKIHLLTSEEPPESGKDQTANCGALVSKAAVKFWFDLEDADAAHLNSIRICGHCFSTRKAGGRYLAGIVNGQEALTERINA